MDPKASARQFVQDWYGLFGDRLRSALLFGSVARGEAVPEVSDINVLLLVDQIDAAMLKRASSVTRKWIKESRQPPLVFEIEQWKRASDVFAIEISDMVDAHELLHGEDPLRHAAIDEQELRHQAESELRGKLLQLQTALLIAANTPADVGRILLNSIPSFTAYLRAVLRLVGQTVPAGTVEAIQLAANQVGASPASFVRVWEARRARSSFKLAVDDPLVDAYYDTAEKTADFVDNLRR